MQISRTTPLVVAAFALATIACQDATRSPTAPDAPVFNFSNGPPSPGKSGVLRFQQMEVFGTVDGALQVIAFHLPPDAFAPFACGGADLPVFESQYVNTLAGIARSVTQVHDAPIYIYDLAAFEAAFSGDLCGFLATGWLYQGTHDLILVGDFSGSGTILGWNGHGNVVDQSGDQFRYREHQIAVVAKDGSLRWQVETIDVH